MVGFIIGMMVGGTVSTFMLCAIICGAEADKAAHHKETGK
ncbi:MAG: DUF3789 domain-containing protein [Clostridia bacterium]|nr:DUF3789 domain-containing protein [Clostridia bacterium]